MPGICGRVAASNGTDLGELLAEMLQRMKHHDWYVTHAYVDGAAGVALGRTSLGFVNAADQPAVSGERTMLCVMEGEIYDHAELQRTLHGPGRPVEGDSHAELLLSAYQRQGSGFLGDVEGAFSAAIWDGRSRRLILLNDRFGMKPLYYARRPGGLTFASEIKALLADPEVSRRADLRGLSQFLTYGQLLGEGTLLEGLKVLPAAAWLVYDVDQDRLTLERYWRPAAAQGAEGSENEHLDRIDTAFKRAVDRRTAGNRRLGLSLSGGLDSRTILAAVDPDRPLTCVSMGVEGSMDHGCAARMARLAARPHHSCYLSTEFLAQFEAHLRRMVHLTDGHYLSQCVVMPTLPVYRELGVEVLLRGHAGELMHMNKAYNFSLDAEGWGLRDAATLESWLFRHLQAYMLEGVEGPLLAAADKQEVERFAREALQSCLAEHRDTRPVLHQVWQLFIDQRSRRETAMSLVKFGSVVETRLPYLDGGLVEALLAAPPALKRGDRLQAHILRRRMPALLDVVNVNTGARMGAGRLASWFGLTRMKVYAKLRVRGYQPYERLGLWLRRELRPLVKKVLLTDRCLERGVFDPDTVRAVVHNHFANRRNHTFLLMALMIYELGQREFVDAPTETELIAR